MIISDITYKQHQHEWELSALVQCDNARRKSFRLWYRMSHKLETISNEADAFLAAMLIPAMYSAENIHIEGSISSTFLQSTEKIHDLFQQWYPDKYARIKITASEIRQPLAKPLPAPVGCLFSGGVDSWYTMLKNIDEITHLILIRGFDLPGSREDRWQNAVLQQQKIADHFGKQLVTVSTNIKKYSDISKPSAGWGKLYHGNFWRPSHGSALCSVLLTHQTLFSKSIIAASLHYKYHYPYGSHPDLDILWSSGDMPIIHDGHERVRADKLLYAIDKNPLILQHLRVCQFPVTDAYNCCHCEKCLRTMIILRIAGKLDEASCFPEPLDLKKVGEISLPRAALFDRIYENLLEQARKKGDQELCDSLLATLGKKSQLKYLAVTIRQKIFVALLRLLPRKYHRGLQIRFRGVYRDPYHENYPNDYVLQNVPETND